MFKKLRLEVIDYFVDIGEIADHNKINDPVTWKVFLPIWPCAILVMFKIWILFYIKVITIMIFSQ